MPVKGNKKADRRYYFTNHEIYYADRTIARFIWQILKRYKKKERVHYPGWDEADTPEEWEDLLDEFIWTFDQIARGGPDSPVRKCMANYKDEAEYKKVMKEEKAYQKRARDNLQLFAKFFNELWDMEESGE